MDKTLQKILYVEDEEDVRFIVQIALEDIAGFTLKICSSGYEALSTVEAFQPDLILLDVMMPGMDGPATLIELKKMPFLEQTPILFMTARVHDDEVLRYKALGIEDIIPKPFEPLTLATTLHDFWSKYNERKN